MGAGPCFGVEICVMEWPQKPVFRAVDVRESRPVSRLARTPRWMSVTSGRWRSIRETKSEQAVDKFPGGGRFSELQVHVSTALKHASHWETHDRSLQEPENYLG